MGPALAEEPKPPFRVFVAVDCELFCVLKIDDLFLFSAA